MATSPTVVKVGSLGSMMRYKKGPVYEVNMKARLVNWRS